MYKTVNDFYGRNISITFDLIHKLEEEGSKLKEEKTATVKITSVVKSVASSEESLDWHITIERTFFYGYLVINHLSYNSEDNTWYNRVCLQENQKYDYKNYCVAENIKVEIL